MVLNDQGGQYMNISRNVVGTLRANSRSHEPILYDISHRGDGIRTVGDISTTLTAHMGTGGNNVPIVQEKETVGSLCADMAKGINNQYVGQNQVQADERGIRRLTPLECERLQGLPDGWTDVGISDSSRYRMIGNGMAQPCADYVLEKAAQALQKKNTSPKRNS